MILPFRLTTEWLFIYQAHHEYPHLLFGEEPAKELCEGKAHCNKIFLAFAFYPFYPSRSGARAETTLYMRITKLYFSTGRGRKGLSGRV